NSRIENELENLNWVDSSDLVSARATGYGLAGFVDGVVPFYDPLAAAGAYDPGFPGVAASQQIGALTRDIDLALWSAGATMETQAAATSGGNWVTRNVFRWGTYHHGPHFHLGPGTRVVEAHRILLPSFQGARGWWFHANAVVSRWMRSL
ncbi:MAG TPA: hypothetical protein P5234_15125, partial [Thermoanaerobaculaceae bacterium]|nr:hypothetical protein [Thermoanaerobaculaceae bacterium]